MLQIKTSLANSQKLVDTLVQHKNDEGISAISQSEIARSINRSQTWVSQAIRRINTEDTCIEIIGESQYVVHYSNLSERGVYSTILDLISLTLKYPEILRMQDNELSRLISSPVKTIQMYKAYMRDIIKTTLTNKTA